MQPDTQERNKYGTVLRIFDQEYDDPEFMEFIQKDAIMRWYDMVKEEGWTPDGEPIAQVDVSIAYGWPLYGSDDEPILGDDGEQLTDPVKAILTVHGWVVRS